MDHDAGDIGLVKFAQDFGQLALSHIPSPNSTPRKPRLSRGSSSYAHASPHKTTFDLPDPDTGNTLADDIGPPSPRSLIGSGAGLNRSRTLPRSNSRRGQAVSTMHDEETTLGTAGFGKSGVLADVAPLDHEVVSKLRRWMLFNFDLELGPVIAGVYPPFPLSAAVAENIAFFAFPDSPQFAEGSQSHSFRFREDPSDAPVSPDGFIYGFARFTRRRDKFIRRGYDQRCLIVLTHHPWPALFSQLVEVLGQMYVQHGGPMLEAACHDMANWPDPTPGSTLELGFLGTVLTASIPTTTANQSLISTSTSPAISMTSPTLREKLDPETRILASLGPSLPCPLLHFVDHITHIWSIWECMMLCEPILVYGPTPTATCETIWWLIEALEPMGFSGDFRPYFTIHDKDFATLVNKNTPKTGLVLGVTNPIFPKLCEHWPHVLSLQQVPAQARGNGSVAGNAVRGGVKKVDFVKGFAPGWKTKTHNRYISKDRSLLAWVEDCLRGNDYDLKVRAAHVLRNHFNARTTAFLAPLSRYLNTLIPLPSETARSTSRPGLGLGMGMGVRSLGGSAASSSTSLASQTHTGAHLKVLPPPPPPLLSVSHSEPIPPSPSSKSSSPLNPTSPHIASTTPPPPAAAHLTTKSLSPTPLPPRLKPFNTAHFLASLKTHGSPLPFRSATKQREFYERWLRTPAFAGWLVRQEEEVGRVLAKG